MREFSSRVCCSTWIVPGFSADVENRWSPYFPGILATVTVGRRELFSVLLCTVCVPAKIIYPLRSTARLSGCAEQVFDSTRRSASSAKSALVSFCSAGFRVSSSCPLGSRLPYSIWATSSGFAAAPHAQVGAAERAYQRRQRIIRRVRRRGASPIWAGCPRHYRRRPHVPAKTCSTVG